MLRSFRVSEPFALPFASGFIQDHLYVYYQARLSASRTSAKAYGSTLASDLIPQRVIDASYRPASRAKMYQKTDELVERVSATESAVSNLNNDMTSVKEVTAEVTRWKLMGLGALGVTGMAAAALASLITAHWTDISRFLRGG